MEQCVVGTAVRSGTSSQKDSQVVLRPYQREAVDAVYRHLRERDDNPCVVSPTASGKSWIIAQIASDAVLRWSGRVLVLAHVKELLDQNAEKIRLLCPNLDVGIYSAGLRRRDTQHSVIVAGIQSIYKRACELDRFDLIIVDEAHMLPPGEAGEGMYRQFLADATVVNPNVRLIGLTATPYRMKSGMICGPDNLLNAICYEVGVKELIVQGYLCPLVTKAGLKKVDTSRLHMRGGEFVASEAEELMDQDELVEAACREIIHYTQDRNTCLIFAAGVAHAKHIQSVLQKKHQVECGLVTGDTPSGERDELLARFRGEKVPANLFGDSQEPLKYLVNVNCLTTGTDVPSIDAVVLLRPTASAGLFVQMVGRGFRLHPGKKNCIVLDYGGNILRHGPVDQIKVKEGNGSGNGDAPAKECPKCHSVIAAGYATCPDCGYLFPESEKQKHDDKASSEGILSGQATDTVFEVQGVVFSVHTKRGADEFAPKTMRVDYRVGFNQYKSEWIAFEHYGWARQKAVEWWQQRSNDPVPATAQRAVDIANGGGVCPTKRITVRSVTGEKFDKIIAYELGEKPEPVPAHVAMRYSVADVPF